MINQQEMMTTLEKYRGDAIVVTTMTASGAWGETSHLLVRHVPVSGAMGKASSVALGLALARPDIKVIVLDGDGSLLMNLGSLVTIANKQPHNLYHCVMENGVYAITGGQPIPNAGKVSFAEMAKGAGYAAAFEFDNLEDFSIQIEGILKQQGPVFITIKVVPEIQNEPIGRRRRPVGTRSTTVAFQELREELAAR